MPTDSFPDSVDHPARLQALRAVALLDTPEEEAFDRLTRLAARCTGAPAALVSLIDADRQFIKSAVGLPEPWSRLRETPLSISFCRHNRVARKPLVIADARKHPEFRTHPAMEALSAAAYLSVPLLSPDSYVLGSFCVLDSKPRAWTPENIETVRDLAGAAMAEIGRRAEKRRMDKALRKNLLKYKALFEQSADGIFLHDLNGRFVDVNPAGVTQTGYSREELLGLRVFDLIPDPLKAEAILRRWRQWRPDHAVILEEKHRRKDGTVYEAEVNTGRVRFGEADLMLAIVRDITGHKQAEQALRDSEKRFRNLVEMLPVAVFETDPDLRVTFANRHGRKLFGYFEADLKGGIHGLDLIVPEDRDRAEEHIGRRLKGERLGMVEYRVVKKDGSVFPALVLATPIVKEDRFAGFSGLIIDITDKKREESEKMKIANQFRQAQKMESIGRLAGGIAHDLNNLLAPIIGYCELLLHEFDSGDKKREFMNQILGAGLRAKDLVHQLLAFGRKQKMKTRPVHLNQVLVDFEKLLRRTIREDIDIEIVTAHGSPIIQADIGQVEQVIMNLSVNAQDAMPEGGVLSLKTDVVALDGAYANEHPGAVPGRYAMLVISDTGCGMDDETREHLFEPFYTTKGEKGTGLGLATVYGIVQQHGGTVRVDSELERGTVFTIYFPIREKTQPRLNPRRIQKPDIQGTETIVLAEDNAQVLLISKEILERQGYTVLAAENGIAALAVLAAYGKPVHLLLTDVVMPQMNGKALFFEAISKYPNLKVLFMSGYRADAAVSSGMSVNGAPFLQKPFTAQILLSKVREVLDGPKIDRSLPVAGISVR